MDNIFKWDTGIINKLIGYSLKRNMYITIANLRNLQKLLDESDFKIYMSKAIMYKRITFLKNVLKARLDEKLEDQSLIIQYCRTEIDDPVTEDIINNLPKYTQLNHNEIKFLTEYINDRLQFGVLQSHKDELQTILEKINDGEYKTFAHASLMIENWFKEYNAACRACRARYQNNVLDFNDPALKDKVSDVLYRLGNTSSILITGFQLLNEMLSPGLRPSKLYVFMGVTGGYKSAMLLTLALHAVKFNATTYKPKKEGYKPYVLYISMENSKDESFERTYNMEVAPDVPVDHDAGWIVEQLKNNKIAYNDDIGLLIWYEPNKSIDTDGVRHIIDELDSQGKEVILVSFDYIKRIRPKTKSVGTKEELNNITNELRAIAQEYMIAIVTAQQMNRAALAAINMAKRNGETDLIKYVGLENVGDAWEVAENADMTIILVVERRKSDGRLMLAFYRAKSRYRPSTKLEYFYQPFTLDNELKLEVDIFSDHPAGVYKLGGEDTDILDQEEAFDALMTSRGRRQLSRKGKSPSGADFISDELFQIPAIT